MLLWSVLLALVLAAGPPPAAARNAPGSAPEEAGACALLTAAEVETLQGSPVVGTKSHAAAAQGRLVSQCFYQSADFSRSVSLELTRPGRSAEAPGAGRARWLELFHRGAEGAEPRPPRPVDGVGDEAFWTGNPQVGALYALKGDVFLRVSVGGAEDEAARVDRACALARKALRRLEDS